MPWSTWCKALVQEKKLGFFFSFSHHGNALPWYVLLLTSLKACDWSGHIFGASASPRPSTKKKLAVSPSLPLFMAVSLISSMLHSSCCSYFMRHSWLANSGWYECAWTGSYHTTPHARARARAGSMAILSYAVQLSIHDFFVMRGTVVFRTCDQHKKKKTMYSPIFYWPY